jgi:uncharacterized membrane protein
MTGGQLALALSVFLACAVEAVEALTIVIAVGSTRSWSSAIGGVGAAVVVLAGLIAGLGPALTALPLDALRVVIGGLLLIFGLQWLRKAILRSAGVKSVHDELAIFEHEAAAARSMAGRRAGFDGYSFAISFKGVLLEGLEVAFIVLTFGANQHRIGLAAIAAGAAVLVVVLAGLAVRAPLAKVPENTMKFAVGVMLSSFGMFWGVEGAGVDWPGGEAALLAIVPCVLLLALATVTRASRTARGAREPSLTEASPASARDVKRIQRVLLAVGEFVAGDDWPTAAGVVFALALTALIAAAGISAWWFMPLAVIGLLVVSVQRALRPQ